MDIHFSKYKYHIWLHLVVIIFGLTGVLGRLITIDSFLLVWYRVGIAIVAILVYFWVRGFSIIIPAKQLKKTLFVGLILAVHWVAFFESIKQSNVSAALVCFSTGTFFTALIEPIYFKRKVRRYEIILGLIIMLGLYFIFSFEPKYFLGMILSIFSAALASWFTVINGTLVKEGRAEVISFYELLGAFVLVTLFLLIKKEPSLSSFKAPNTDLKWLLILGVVCTAFAFIMSVEVMKKISPYTVTMLVNLEPIYSIILALMIWPESENMSWGFYLGTLIVITTIFLNAFFKHKKIKEKKGLL